MLPDEPAGFREVGFRPAGCLLAPALDCGGGLALVRDAPVYVAQPEFPAEVEPFPALFRIESAVAACVAGAEFRDEDGEACAHAILHAGAERVAVRVRVEVERVHHVPERERVVERPLDVLAPRVRPDDDDRVRRVFPYRGDYLLGVRLQRRIPVGAGRLVADFVEDVPAFRVFARNLGEKRFCVRLPPVVRVEVVHVPVDDDVQPELRRRVDSSPDDALERAFVAAVAVPVVVAGVEREPHAVRAEVVTQRPERILADVPAEFVPEIDSVRAESHEDDFLPVLVEEARAGDAEVPVQCERRPRRRFRFRLRGGHVFLLGIVFPDFRTRSG